jgi:FkbM family methyltransferase
MPNKTNRRTRGCFVLCLLYAVYQFVLLHFKKRDMDFNLQQAAAAAALDVLSMTPTDSSAISSSNNKNKANPNAAATAPPSATRIQQVDCNTLDPILPVNIGRMKSNYPTDAPYLVSFSWWDGRIRVPHFGDWTTKEVRANPSVHAIQTLLYDKTRSNAAFIDVGANVGFMTHFALSLGRHVYAIDPISYDIAKICEGYRANMKNGWVATTTKSSSSDKNNLLHLYHAVAGEQVLARVNITRPSDDVGFFDQASLSHNAVFQKKTVTEHIPMLTIDSIGIPLDMPIGVVKIDVQGHEYGVLLGMHELLSRNEFPPQYIFYEESDKHIEAAGYKVGACRQLLEQVHGYSCTSAETRGDVLCQKNAIIAS